MRLHALSDLHIDGSEDPLLAAVVTLLEKKAEPGDVVVLAGDIFDIWVGNKILFSQRYDSFLRACDVALTRGVQLHYIEGNHDFLLKQAFSDLVGLRLHAQQFELDLAGKRFFFAHGDLVDPTDYGYRLLRLLFRSPVMRLFVQLVPGAGLDWLGSRSSAWSRRSGRRVLGAHSLGHLEKLRNSYRSFAAEKVAQGCDFVVMGHCHDLDEKLFRVGDREGQYINVGFPRVHGSFLSWTEGDAKISRQRIEFLPR